MTFHDRFKLYTIIQSMIFIVNRDVEAVDFSPASTASASASASILQYKY